MKLTTSIPFLLALAVPLQAVEADSLRCRTHLIRLGDTKLDVLEKCGEPRLKELISGANERRVEQWYYRPGRYQFTRILTFRGTRVVDIETVARP